MGRRKGKIERLRHQPQLLTVAYYRTIHNNTGGNTTKYILYNEEYKTVEDAIRSYELMSKYHKMRILRDAIAWKKPRCKSNDIAVAIKVLTDFEIDSTFVEHVLEHMARMTIFTNGSNPGCICEYIGVKDEK